MGKRGIFPGGHSLRLLTAYETLIPLALSIYFLIGHVYHSEGSKPQMLEKLLGHWGPWTSVCSSSNQTAPDKT